MVELFDEMVSLHDDCFISQKFIVLIMHKFTYKHEQKDRKRLSQSFQTIYILIDND